MNRRNFLAVLLGTITALATRTAIDGTAVKASGTAQHNSFLEMAQACLIFHKYLDGSTGMLTVLPDDIIRANIPAKLITSQADLDKLHQLGWKWALVDAQYFIHSLK